MAPRNTGDAQHVLQEEVDKFMGRVLGARRGCLLSFAETVASTARRRPSLVGGRQGSCGTRAAARIRYRRAAFSRAPPQCLQLQCRDVTAESAGTVRSSALPTDFYELLRLPRSATAADVKTAYRTISRQWHPDVVGTSDATLRRFEALQRAYEVLSDATLRRVYDAAGLDGLEAYVSVEQRYQAVARMLEEMRSVNAGGSMRPEELDLLGESGDLAGLLAPAPPPAPETEGATAADAPNACPRSVDEAIANLHHPDYGYRYYALWWLSRFRVRQAEDALIRVLRESSDRTPLGGYPMRRRAAIALGNVGTPKAMGALVQSLDCREDWQVRNRAAEAIAKVLAEHPGVPWQSPDAIALQHQLLALLETYAPPSDMAMAGGAAPPMFDLSSLDDEKRRRLEAIFAKRRQDEARARRLTHTPSLGVDLQSSAMTEPYEWLLKAAGQALVSMRAAGVTDSAFQERAPEVMRRFLEHDVPLVKYAAHKALYQATGDRRHAEALMRALAFGAEHHFSQRVLVRDLGELGCAEAASAIADCPMVENSFKIFALRRLLQRAQRAGAAEAYTARILRHIDALL